MKKFARLNKKYILIFAVGIILMVMGNYFGTRTGEHTEKALDTEQAWIDSAALEKILESVEGAGKVKVFIAYKNDGRKEIAQQIERRDSEIVNIPENIGDTYFVLSNTTPEIAGVLVTATGAADEAVQRRILTAVKRALGIPYSKISVEIGKKS